MSQAAKDIITVVGTLGLGSLIGILVQAIVSHRQEKTRLLFEARVKAYAGISGRIGNQFLELDISRNKALRFAEINTLLSEVNLLGSKKLEKILDSYVRLLNQFHDAMHDKASDEELKKFHSACSEAGKKVFAQMKNDLYL